MSPPGVRWITRLEDAELYLISTYPGVRRDKRDKEAGARGLEAIVWLARHADAERWSLPPPEPADLADAAPAKRCGGAGRLLRRRMLRALIARVFALHPASVRFTRDTLGAPGVAGLDAHISTAGFGTGEEAWSAVALAPVPIGVDVEPGPPTEALTRWTLTEAYLKALGHGLATPPAHVRLTRRDLGAWRLALRDARPGEGDIWPDPRLIAAVVMLSPNTDAACS